MKRYAVIGIGNSRQCDNAVEPLVIRQARERLTGICGLVDFEESYSNGFGLLDLLMDRRKAIIVDSIATGTAPPGACHVIHIGPIEGPKYMELCTLHGFTLLSMLELGKLVGCRMPEEVLVLGVEEGEMVKPGKPPNGHLSSSVEGIVVRIEEILDEWLSDDARDEPTQAGKLN
jgi:hydrogenase maturation protease